MRDFVCFEPGTSESNKNSYPLLLNLAPLGLAFTCHKIPCSPPHSLRTQLSTTGKKFCLFIHLLSNTDLGKISHISHIFPYPISFGLLWFILYRCFLNFCGVFFFFLFLVFGFFCGWLVGLFVCFVAEEGGMLIGWFWF